MSEIDESRKNRAVFAAEVWEKLSSINVNNHVKKKGNLSYLSWAWAWGELMKAFPYSSFEFLDNHLFEDKTAEVWVSLTVSNGNYYVTRKIWLPIMDNRNKAVSNPNARDFNDARMRALTKCMALFGLGHYIYAGEDIPENYVPEPQPAPELKPESSKRWEAAKGVYINDGNLDRVLAKMTISEANKERLINEANSEKAQLGEAQMAQG